MSMEIPEILDAIIGPTGFNGETHSDNVSLDNMDKLAEVADWLDARLLPHLDFAGSEYSGKALCRRAMEIYGTMGLCDRAYAEGYEEMARNARGQV